MELDRMDDKVVAAFSETLASSAFGWRRDVSTPSLPGVGVNKSFKDSDQRHWFMKCPHCNHWFTLIHDFPRCVVELPKDRKGLANHDLHLSNPFIRPEDTYAYICMKCKRFVSDETRILGIWQALYPHRAPDQLRGIRGYQISQLMCAWVSATELMKKKEEHTFEQTFENYVIGRPYLGDNVMLTRGDILRCVDMSITNPYDLRRENIGQGVDWGNTSWGVNGMMDQDNPERLILLDIWNVSDKEVMTDSSGRPDNPHIRKAGEKLRQWQCRKAVHDAGYGRQI